MATTLSGSISPLKAAILRSLSLSLVPPSPYASHTNARISRTHKYSRMYTRTNTRTHTHTQRHPCKPSSYHSHVCLRTPLPSHTLDLTCNNIKFLSHIHIQTHVHNYKHSNVHAHTRDSSHPSKLLFFSHTYIRIIIHIYICLHLNIYTYIHSLSPLQSAIFRSV